MRRSLEIKAAVGFPIPTYYRTHLGTLGQEQLDWLEGK
jgi:hypothetical protein